MCTNVEALIVSLLQITAVDHVCSFIMKIASFLLQNNGMYSLRLQLPALCVFESLKAYSLLWGDSTRDKEGFAGKKNCKSIVHSVLASLLCSNPI